MDTRVLIIGGGEKVAALLDTLRGMKGITLVGVCDVDRNSTGMQHARKLALDTSIDPANFILKKRADIVIETSGSKEFQKVLNQVAQREVKIVDSKASELLLNVAQEKEKAKRYGQLYLVDKLANIFAAECDTHNIMRPIFGLLKKAFNVDVEAILIFYEPKDELMIASEYNMKNGVTDQILGYLRKKSKIKIKKEIKKSKLNIFTQSLSNQPKGSPKLKSFISVPLLARSKQEGMMVLASTQEDAFAPEDIIILNILGDELAFFIENERIKKALAESKGRLESMLHSMSEGVIALDTEQQVTLINPAAKMLLGLKEMRLGRRLWESLEDKNIAELLKKIPWDKKFHIRELSFLLGAQLKTVKFYVAQVCDGLGKPAGWIILLTDITKEKEADSMKSEFISTTSHELRTPLAAIKESVMLILDGTAGKLSPEQNRFLTIAKRNIDRLATLISNLLDLSKIETGKIELKKVPCDISGLVKKALEPMQPLTRENKLDLIYDMGPDLPQLRCDTKRISQVLVNLVANAIKFTPAGGKITVASRLSLIADRRRARPRKFIEISVKDTGIGIEKKHFKKIFARFGQLDSSLTRRVGGTGLGLAICKELVQMHGGKIWVDSERDKGSTFRFTLPI